MKFDILYNLSRDAFEIAIRIFFKMHIVGKENIPDAPFIVAANHASLLDPPLVGIACKWRTVNFMVKQELRDFPVIGTLWTQNVACIPVRRGDNSIKGLREAIRRIKNGSIVGIFPEGTRSVDGSLQEAKTGTGFLIALAKVPVLPIYSFGTAEALPRGQKAKIGSKVGAIVGKPISLEELGTRGKTSKEDYEKIGNLVMERIAALKPEGDKILEGKR